MKIIPWSGGVCSTYAVEQTLIHTNEHFLTVNVQWTKDPKWKMRATKMQQLHNTLILQHGFFSRFTVAYDTEHWHELLPILVTFNSCVNITDQHNSPNTMQIPVSTTPRSDLFNKTVEKLQKIINVELLNTDIDRQHMEQNINVFKQE